MYEGKEEIHKYIQYEVSITVCVGRIANQRKIPKWLPFKQLQVRITKYLMCIYEGHRCTCVPKKKSVCLTLWLGEVCTDANTNNDDAKTDHADNTRWTKHDCMKLFG